MSHQLEHVKAALAGRYAVEREIGRGGMATVYLAEDLKHGRKVALKVLRSELSAAVGGARFLREIQIAARLTHPHIVPVHDSGEHEGLLYYVMPYVEGESLRDRIEREKQLPVADALKIACDVAEALAAAHRKDVVHRDVKPGNILLEEGHALVADFGLASAVSVAGAERLTETGIAMGTPFYMSPEQASGDETVDSRSDLYSLSCVLYEMLAGQPPFTGLNARAVIARHLIDEVPPLKTVRPDIPDHVARAVSKALAKEKADRFGSLMDFADALAAEEEDLEEPSVKSIAVLPFVNMSPSAEDEYLSDGMTEEIINALTKIEPLHVVSRTSVFAFKDKHEDVRSIGRQLNVQSVLGGSLRRAGDRLRITTELVDVADGYQLWSARYDREMEDVFAIQDEISECIARAMKVILSDDERRAISRSPTSSVKAYEFYLRGRQFLNQMRKKSLYFALEMFTRAIEIDPDYALAYAGIADCCSQLNMYYPSIEHDLERADSASRKALKLDPDLPEAHAARGFALARMERDDEAIREFEAAIRLDPKLYEGHYFYARTCFQRGKYEKAAELFEKASRVREDYQSAFFAAQSYAGMGRKAEAEAAYRRALRVVEGHLELNPDDPRAATMCAVALCRSGEPEKGLKWAERALAIDPEDAGVRYNVACLYAVEGETERALDCLEEVLRMGFGNTPWIEHDPDLESLRGHPRFEALTASD